MSNRPLRILMFCDDSRSHADTVLEHLAAFRRYSKHDVDFFNPMGVVDSRHLRLSAYDVVAIHYSLVITSDGYLSPALREKIRVYDGLKVQFLQDEYRWVDDISAMMRHLGTDVLFSIVPEREIEKVYGGRIPDTRIVPTLAGYVPEKLVGYKSRRVAERPIDVGYRGRVLPFWNGRLSQEKVWIARGFLERAEGTGLRHDIAWGENDRIYGARWHEFLASCRVTLGSESGTSITDFDGSVEAAVTRYLEQHPGATFEETSQVVLGEVEGNVMMNVVSPRLFEAAAIGTGMVMFPGEYGGTVEPWEHYVPLDKDFGNFEEVVAAIRDVQLIQRLADNARRDVIDSSAYSLRRFMETFDATVSEYAVPAARRDRAALLRAKVDRARSTRTALGFDPKQRAHRFAQNLAAARATLADPALRRLAVAYLCNSELRSRVRPTRLAADILRLDVLRRAQLGIPPEPDVLAVAARFDPDGTLVFVGLPLDAPPLPTIGTLPLEETRVFLWDNRSVSLLFRAPVPGRGVRQFAVGYYGVIGIHHFGTLPQLMRALPSETAAVLAPLRAPQPYLEPAAAVVRLDRLGVTVVRAGRAVRAAGGALRRSGRLSRLALRVARLGRRDPRVAAAKAVALARALGSDAEVRRLVGAWRGSAEARALVTPESLLGELLRLHLLRRLAAGSVAGVGVERHEDEGSIWYIGVAGPTARTEPPRVGTKLIVWDHASLGGTAGGEGGHPPVRVGEGGRREFRALHAIVQATEPREGGE